MDFLSGAGRKLVTPISLQPQFGRSKAELAKKRRREKAVLAVAAALVVVLVGNTFVGGLRQDDRSITLGSKDFTEQLILCNLYADVIEHDTDISVERKENLGGSQVCFEAMEKGEIDMYVDYTGTVYVNILNHEAKSYMEAVYQECRDNWPRAMPSPSGPDSLQQYLRWLSPERPRQNTV
ncbi:MAG: glycine betaine ABC transporter substrate-binding protein [Clostridia bacterium]